MQFHVHVVHVQDPAIARELERLNRNLEIFMSGIDDFVTLLTSRLTAQKTQVDGIATLLSSIKHQLADALRGENLSPAAKEKLAAIMPALEANTTEITDAINANTDLAPTPVPPAPVDFNSPPLDTPPDNPPSASFSSKKSRSSDT